MTATTWDPSLYLDFDDHRARPFHDLLARVRNADPRRVVDLGCGPGHLTSVLFARWPDAVVDAIDSSPAMVAAARASGVEAVQQDVVDWMPSPDTDVVVTNALLQWVPSHPDLLPRWISALPAGASFAMQVPGNFGAPSHALLRELADEPEWHGRLTLRDEGSVLEPTEYAALLSAAGAEVDVWETTYVQRLSGEDPVLRWISGTAMRPVRDALDDAGYARFVEQLRPRLRQAYPRRPDGTTWFPFRRLFAVARTP
ncbi:MAG: trans-aconitate 2-methyltransferase [Pseudonocardia sp.]|nr:trans-aconitate 2-methyltransferase [Pseudonocardia sp.]